MENGTQFGDNIIKNNFTLIFVNSVKLISIGLEEYPIMCDCEDAVHGDEPSYHINHVLFMGYQSYS